MRRGVAMRYMYFRFCGLHDVASFRHTVGAVVHHAYISDESVIWTCPHQTLSGRYSLGTSRWLDKH